MFLLLGMRVYKTPEDTWQSGYAINRLPLKSATVIGLRMVRFHSCQPTKIDSLRIRSPRLDSSFQRLETG